MGPSSDWGRSEKARRKEEQMRRFYVSRVNSNPCERDLLPFLLLHCTPKYFNFKSSCSKSTGSREVSAYSGGAILTVSVLALAGGPVSGSQPGAASRPSSRSQPFGSVLIERRRHVGSPTTPNIVAQSAKYGAEICVLAWS